jgi:hypothetical protein
LINFFFKALFAAASVAKRISEAASRNLCCSLASLGFLAAPYRFKIIIGDTVFVSGYAVGSTNLSGNRTIEILESLNRYEG